MTQDRISLMDVHGSLSHLVFAVQQNLEHTQVTPSGVERYERAKAAIAKATQETDRT